MENSTISISSRIDARTAIQKAVAKMPRTSSVETFASGRTRACFRPSDKVRPSAVPSVTEPVAAEVPVLEAGRPKARAHRYPTAERVTQLLVGGVKRNLDRGMGRPQAFDRARSWLLDKVLTKNEDLKDEDRAARTDQVTSLDPIAFWAAFDANRAPVGADCVRPDQTVATQPTSPVAHTSESLLAALAGADQVTAGGDLLEISDEPEIPVVQKPAPEQEQGLKRLPLTTPGHLDDVVALFIERNKADGMDDESAVRRACGKMFREIESDKTLSPEDVEGLKRQLRAKLPKRAPTHTPVPAPVPFTVPGQIDREIDLHVERNEKERGMEHDDALRCAVGLVWSQVDEDTSLSTAEREDCIQQCQARLPVREQTARAPRGMEFLDRACPVREPKRVADVPLTPEQQARHKAEKRAARIARAEESARKSRTLGECAMHAIAAPKSKKEKKANKGNRGQRANAGA